MVNTHPVRWALVYLIMFAMSVVGCDDADDDDAGPPPADGGVDAARVDHGTDAGPDAQIRLDAATPSDATMPDGAVGDGAVADATPGDAGVVGPRTRCNPNAMVPELCAPDGANQVIEIDLDVQYHTFPAVPLFSKPGGEFNNGRLTCGDVYLADTEIPLRTYRSRETGQAEWSGPAYPGPTVRLKLGDTLRVNFSNSIPANAGMEDVDPLPRAGDCNPNHPEEDRAPNCFHGDNVTNIHYHGTHVSPQDNGAPQFIEGMPNPDYRLVDNVYVRALPADYPYAPPVLPAPDCVDEDCWLFRGDAVPQYVLEFGERQVPGTHWYHAHKHGSTAIQMLNGLAGALIIEGDFVGIREIEQARDQVLVVQQIDGRTLNLARDADDPVDQEAGARHENAQLFVNGRLAVPGLDPEPTIVMQSGEVQRWRFISATQRAQASFKGLELTDVIGEVPPGVVPQAEGACNADGTPNEDVFRYDATGVYQIAQDGVEFLDARWQDLLCGKTADGKPKQDAYLDVDFDSGNRADFLVVAPKNEGDADLVVYLRKDAVVVGGSGVRGGGGGGGGGPGGGGGGDAICKSQGMEEAGEAACCPPNAPNCCRTDPSKAHCCPDSCPDCTPQPGWGRFMATSGNTLNVPLLKIIVKPADAANPPPVTALPKHLRTPEMLPPGLRSVLAPITDAELLRPNGPDAPTRTVEFQMNPSPGGEPQFYIDCQQFCATRLDHCMSLDTAEEWKINNYTTVSHPFHIHINPFFITHLFDAKTHFALEKDPFCVLDCGEDAGCADACGPPDPMAPLDPRAGLLAPNDPQRRWQDTIGLPHAYMPDVVQAAVCADAPIADAAAAADVCPDVCAARGGWPEGDTRFVCGSDRPKDLCAGMDCACVCAAPPQPPIVPGFVKMRTRFVDFSGDFVIHCHILGHEDRGMMQRIGVRGDAATCQAAYSMLDGSECHADPESAALAAAKTECCQTCQSDNEPRVDGMLSERCGTTSQGNTSRECTY